MRLLKEAYQLHCKRLKWNGNGGSHGDIVVGGVINLWDKYGNETNNKWAREEFDGLWLKCVRLRLQFLCTLFWHAMNDAERNRNNNVKEKKLCENPI